MYKIFDGRFPGSRIVILKKPMYLIKEAVQEFFIDNCPQLAAAISFYLLFSIFPLALVIISVTGFILKSPATQVEVIEGIGSLLPVSGDFIASTIKGVVSTRTTVGIAATIGLILGSMSMFYTVSKSLNAAWGIHQPRPFFRERLLDFCMMVGAGLLLLASISLTTGFRIASQLDLPVWGAMLMENSLFWHCILSLISAALTFVVFLFLYKFVPHPGSLERRLGRSLGRCNLFRNRQVRIRLVCSEVHRLQPCIWASRRVGRFTNMDLYLRRDSPVLRQTHVSICQPMKPLAIQTGLGRTGQKKR